MYSVKALVYVRKPVRFASDAFDSCTVDVLTEGSVYLLVKVGGGAQAASHPILCLGFGIHAGRNSVAARLHGNFNKKILLLAF